MLELNKIYLGDSNELIKKLDDASVDIIYTDVPYLYNGGNLSNASRVSKSIGKVAAELAENGIDSGFDYAIFNEFVRVMKKINCFIWCSKLQIFDIANWWLNWSKESGRKIFYEILVYTKANPIPATNNVWLPDVEYCLYFRERGVRLNDGYDNKHKAYHSSINVADKYDYGHPTCKPLDFVTKNIAHVMPKGVAGEDNGVRVANNVVVLDPFVGSGTSCVAAKSLGLSWIGFEINEEYYKIACDRMSGFNQKGEMNLFEYEQVLLDLD